MTLYYRNNNNYGYIYLQQMTAFAAYFKASGEVTFFKEGIGFGFITA